MKIGVISRKGGVGKTPIALSLAIDLDYFFITNDMGIATAVFPDRSKYMETPAVLENTIYDFGGFVSAGVIDIIKECNLVIIPVINDDDAFVKTILTINEIRQHAKKIIIVATRTEKGDFEIIKDEVSKHFDGLTYFELKRSKIFKKVTSKGRSLLQSYNRGPLSKHSYRNVIAQYKDLLSYIKESSK